MAGLFNMFSNFGNSGGQGFNFTGMFDTLFNRQNPLNTGGLNLDTPFGGLSNIPPGLLSGGPLGAATAPTPPGGLATGGPLAEAAKKISRSPLEGLGGGPESVQTERIRIPEIQGLLAEDRALVDTGEGLKGKLDTLLEAAGVVEQEEKRGKERVVAPPILSPAGVSNQPVSVSQLPGRRASQARRGLRGLL